MPNRCAERAAQLLRSQDGFQGNPPPSNVAAAQALALVAIAQELSRANDAAEVSGGADRV